MTADELFPVVLAGRVALRIERKTLTRAPVPARWIQSASDPGTTLYSCPDHVVTLGAGPAPDDALRAPQSRAQDSKTPRSASAGRGSLCLTCTHVG